MEAELFDNLLQLVREGNTITNACIKLNTTTYIIYSKRENCINNKKYVLSGIQRKELKETKILNAKYPRSMSVSRGKGGTIPTDWIKATEFYKNTEDGEEIEYVTQGY